MGAVFVAEHARLHRRVAVKVLAAHLATNSKALARFVQEAEVISKLEHPHVVSVMDFAPNHHIGLQYARTDAGWLLAPQFRPNEELYEIRYQWRSERFPLLEARIRTREDKEQEVGTEQKRFVFDGFVRLTWRFTIKE